MLARQHSKHAPAEGRHALLRGGAACTMAHIVDGTPCSASLKSDQGRNTCRPQGLTEALRQPLGLHAAGASRCSPGVAPP